MAPIYQMNQIAIIKKRMTNPHLKNLFQNILKIIIKMKNILKIQQQFLIYLDLNLH